MRRHKHGGHAGLVLQESNGAEGLQSMLDVAFSPAGQLFSSCWQACIVNFWVHELTSSFPPIMMINLVHFLECLKLKYWPGPPGCLPTRFRTFYSKFLNVSVNIESKYCFRKLKKGWVLFSFVAESVTYVI